MSDQVSPDLLTAAVLVIGDEILSGRTQDTNTATIARFLAVAGHRPEGGPGGAR